VLGRDRPTRLPGARGLPARRRGVLIL